MSGVFGACVAGRLVQTDFSQVDELHFVINLPEPETINHVLVFMTGQQPFPTEEMGGAVYIHWPLANETIANWHYLGFITNRKPSAIFRVAKLKDVAAQQQSTFGQPTGFPTPSAVQIGICIEPLNEIAAKTGATGTEATTQATFIEFAQKMVKSFINHAASFAVKLTSPSSGLPTDYVPAAAIQDWCTNFERRLANNPEFWRDLNVD